MDVPTMLATIAKILGYSALGLFVLTSLLLWWIRPSKVSSDVPGPKRHWLFGVMFEDVGWAQWPSLSLAWSRRFGNGEHGFRTWGGPTLNMGFGGAFFNVVSPRCLQHIARDNFENYVKSKLTKSFDEMFGSAVFTTDGEAWRIHRKMVVGGLMNRETVQYAGTLLASKLAQTGEYLDHLEGEIVDMQDVAFRLIFDVFVKLAFGVELNQLSVPSASDNGEEQEKPDRGLSETTLSEYADAFDKMQMCVHERFNDMLWEVKQRYCIGQRERDIARCKQVIDDFAYAVIRKAKERTRKDSGGVNSDDPGPSSASIPQDMINRYLSYCQKSGQVEPTDKDLRDMIMTLSLAGRDTTAVSIAWALYELSRHPAWIERVREEVDEVCGQKGDISVDMCVGSKLSVVHAVVMETLRLHSPAPDNFRFAVRDDVLPDGTVVPSGSLVMFSAYTINHSEHVWGADADSFDPSRWLGHGEPSPFSFPTFHAGPRMCPGKSLAMMELKMSLAYFLRRYNFEDVCGHDGSYRWTIVMSMKSGFPVRVTRRV